MNNKKKSLEDKGKTFLWIVVAAILVFIIGFNIYSGLTVSEIGIPGIFTIKLDEKKPIEPPKLISLGIPLSAGWKAEGPAAVGEEYKDGIMVLKISSHPEEYDNNYAQLCLDLTRTHSFPELERNPDGTYNLVKTEITAAVRSDQNFEGDINNPNIAYFTLFNNTDNLFGNQLDITDVMMSSNGMEIFFEVPENSTSKDVRGICSTFAFSSNKIYNGSINVLNVTIKKI